MIHQTVHNNCFDGINKIIFCNFCGQVVCDNENLEKFVDILKCKAETKQMDHCFCI